MSSKSSGLAFIIVSSQRSTLISRFSTLASSRAQRHPLSLCAPHSAVCAVKDRRRSGVGPSYPSLRKFDSAIVATTAVTKLEGVIVRHISQVERMIWKFENGII
ncbi:unnamed protein product [Alternaria alternata]